jgi:alkanesulfonate monooxygenase SsuD/methylene tetrahydromethanopterin reductase-like flavin-dependent oxidoreductase (luciferase family)
VSPLHLGVILPNFGPELAAEALADTAVAAERSGFDSAWVTDHLIVPAELAGVYGTVAEALVSLGFLAARTQRIALGVSALVVPQRNPLVALRQLATLDFLSGGRIVTAVAAGWLEREFANLGAAYEGRGRVLDEWLELAPAVFQQMPGRIRYEGRSFALDGWIAPALVRPDGLEFWVAGVSPATLRRAALTGVWHPVALPPDELRQMAADLRGLRPESRTILRIGMYFEPEPGTRPDERGRHAISGPPEWLAERLREYIDAGADGFVVNLDHEAPGLEERVARFAEEVTPLIRR